jgi:hypothetical protein
MALDDVWATWAEKAAPYTLDSDVEQLFQGRGRRHIVTWHSWEDAMTDPGFCAPSDSRLHLGLLPQPFFGNLRTATIYVLLLNPGLGPSDYYGEYKVAEYRRALLDNLKQRVHGGGPFLWLDPRFAWHGGFDWWHGKLAKVIERLAAAWDVPFSEARARLASELASIELLPYHSKNFRDRGGWLRNLPSVQLAQRFVTDFVLPRVQRGDATLIITRKTSEWGINEQQGVVIYRGGETRAAHLSPESRGGRAILNRLIAT